MKQQQTKKPILGWGALEKFLTFIMAVHDVKIKSQIKDKLVGRPDQEFGGKNFYSFTIYFIVNIRWIKTTKNPRKESQKKIYVFNQF